MAHLECHNSPLITLSSSVSSILASPSNPFSLRKPTCLINNCNYIAITLAHQWLSFSLRVEIVTWTFLIWYSSGSSYSPGVILSFTFPVSIIHIFFVFLEMLCFFQLETFEHILPWDSPNTHTMGHGMQYLHGVRNDNPLEYSYH